MPQDKNRQRIGVKVSIVGIVSNVVLFALKCMVGTAGNSVSVLIDAFNNLMDSISSIIAIIGFKLCTKEKDEKHPKGYGRMEYISGLIVSFLIIGTALSFIKTSIERIINPQPLNMPSYLLWITAVTIIAKLVLALYTYFMNKKVNSIMLQAMVKDSAADAVLTIMTLGTLVVSRWTSLPLDGMVGLLIAGILLWTGAASFLEHIDLLLGKGTDKELAECIKKIVLEKKDVFYSVEEISTYEFGPEKQEAFIQVALKVSPHSKRVQQNIQEVVYDLKRQLNIDARIYWSVDTTGHHGTIQ
ncbi:MAG: cation diffusion facilitator family transporter [Selenomonadaceae bacterium]